MKKYPHFIYIDDLYNIMSTLVNPVAFAVSGCSFKDAIICPESGLWIPAMDDIIY